VATVCQLIDREDGKILWSDDAQQIYNRYRALYPWPGVYTFWKRNEVASGLRLKLNKVSLIKNNPEAKHQMGEVFQIGDKIGVQTNLGVIFLEEVQLEGKSNMEISQFINGYSDFVGSVLV
jgi:methionyl-tRNA formyltransferase